MTAQQTFDHLISGDHKRVIDGAWGIINNRYHKNFIQPFIEHLPLIHEKTDNLDMGHGMVMSNKRFVNCAVKTIELHRDGVQCPCVLHRELECFNPDTEEGSGHIIVVDRIFAHSNYIDYFIVECKHCKQRYKVTENDYHFRYWDWQPTSGL